MRTTTAPHDDSESPHTPIDVPDALSRLGDDRELLSAIIEIYLEDSPALLDKIRRAVMGNDPHSLQRAAHNLKGLAVTLSAGDVAAAASRLEHMGSSSSLSDAVPVVTELESHLNDLKSAVQPYVKHPR
jgi:HPt (histidine-containing phosphotransfer) domain-containing protein